MSIPRKISHVKIEIPLKLGYFIELDRIDFIDEWKKKISDKNILVDYFHSGHRRSGLK